MPATSVALRRLLAAYTSDRNRPTLPPAIQGGIVDQLAVNLWRIVGANFYLDSSPGQARLTFLTFPAQDFELPLPERG